MIAVTAYISTDIAAAPLLWVLPLALYLLTFVAVFRDKPWFSHDLVIKIVPFLAAPLAITLLGGDREYWLATMALNLLALFVLALACHGEVYARRPAPARLTEFYLWTSFGGVIGGIFAGLLAPHLFNQTYEYPILVVAALLALPGALSGTVREFMWRIWPAPVAAATAVILYYGFDLRLPPQAALFLQAALVMLVCWMLFQRRDPARLAALAIVGFVITGFWQPGLRLIETTRSFFGVHRVVETTTGTHRLLVHGNTIHGAERVREADGTPVQGKPEPLTYYYFRRPDLRGDRSGARRAGPVEQRCGGRARGGEPRLPPARRRDLDVLRDRPGGRAAGARSEHVPLHVELRAVGAGRARRCAAHPCGIGAAIRSHHPRCLLL